MKIAGLQVDEEIGKVLTEAMADGWEASKHGTRIKLTHPDATGCVFASPKAGDVRSSKNIRADLARLLRKDEPVSEEPPEEHQQDPMTEFLGTVSQAVEAYVSRVDGSAEWQALAEDAEARAARAETLLAESDNDLSIYRRNLLLAEERAHAAETALAELRASLASLAGAPA